MGRADANYRFPPMRRSKCKSLILRGIKMVREAGIEPTTCGSGGRHSIQLSYSRTTRIYYAPFPFGSKQIRKFRSGTAPFDSTDMGMNVMSGNRYESLPANDRWPDLANQNRGLKGSLAARMLLRCGALILRMSAPPGLDGSAVESSKVVGLGRCARCKVSP